MRSLIRPSFASLLLAAALFIGAAGPAAAGLDQAAMALAGPLAEQFGVPADAVSKLLEDGVGLESVTQLLLVSQSSDKSLDDVSQLYQASDSDIGNTAEQLEVPESAYSDDVVTSTIDKAKEKLQADSTDAATEEAGKALDSVLGGMKD